MKQLRTFVLIAALTLPAYAWAQSTGASSRSSKQGYKYERKTKRHQLRTADSSDINAILKDSSNAETGPILNDNGTVNSTGTVDGSRSSTGRPDADSSSTYTVKRRKTVIKKR